MVCNDINMEGGGQFGGCIPYSMHISLVLLSFAQVFSCCRNCEDLAMSFLSASATGAPPIWIKDKWLSKMNEIGRYDMTAFKIREQGRNKCLSDLISLFGSVPLAATSMKAFRHKACHQNPIKQKKRRPHLSQSPPRISATAAAISRAAAVAAISRATAAAAHISHATTAKVTITSAAAAAALTSAAIFLPRSCLAPLTPRLAMSGEGQPHFPPPTVEQVKDQEQQLKKQFKAVKSLVEMSGFGWDGDKKMVSAPSEVWEPLINTNKELRKWHNKPFPWYEALYDIYEGTYAEGKRARGCEYYSNFSRGSSSASHIDLSSQPESPLATIPGVGVDFDEHVEETQEVDLSAQIPSASDIPHPVQMPPPSQSQTQTEGEAKTTSSCRKRKQKKENIDKMGDYLIVKERGDDKIAKAIITAAELQTKGYHDDKYSVDKCMEVFYALPNSWTADEVFKASRVFQRKKKNREAWLSLKDEHRTYWIRRAWEEGI
uniref:Myb/SANT-like domain-containing protein n=2 Tax=Ananas comosus var. bracteatus TaxID=296719 RepID=A0A6V7PI02_ANACO|nr:unnamed protein product [Ananas comosus var. bracteatus]